ncbi:MAG: DUF2156 domain-containing protein [Firmicutes bacterium]|nr:DUF2156 domain-containing protein [Bacillota bacterium]
MTDFKKLELDDRDIFQRYLGDYRFNTYEYSFLTLYIWRKMLNVEFGIIDDALIIKKSTKKTGTYFMQPVGYRKESLKSIVLKLNSIRKNDENFKNLFRDIEIPFLYELLDIFEGKICFCEDINNFDYICNSEDLILLSGKKFHRKKNQYNQFINNYKYEIKDFNDSKVIEDCIKFSGTWFHERGNNDCLLRYELESIEEVLPKSGLLGIKGMAVYVDGHLAGFTAGEKVNSNMGVIHFEKGDLSYNGIYSFINKTFVEKYFSDVKFVNMQEDMGIKGLRKAKKAYNPVKLEKKFIVNLL